MVRNTNSLSPAGQEISQDADGKDFVPEDSGEKCAQMGASLIVGSPKFVVIGYPQEDTPGQPSPVSQAFGCVASWFEVEYSFQVGSKGKAKRKNTSNLGVPLSLF